MMSDFVDRENELALFRRMLHGETAERILLILERGEQGKTAFLQRLLYECEERPDPIPVVLLDFNRPRTGLIDYLGVASTIRRYLGDDLTPRICTYETAMSHPPPLVNIQTGAGDAGVDFGKRNRFDEAKISDFAGRDNIHVGNVSGSILAVDPRQRQAEMGRAMRDDLAAVATSRGRVVILIDTFEQIVDQETCRWLEHWLFEPLRRELANVLVVAAGRPECNTFFGHRHLWLVLIRRLDRFTPLSEEHVREYYRQRGFDIPDTQTYLIRLALTSPGFMATLGDRLQLVHGGRL